MATAAGVVFHDSDLNGTQGATEAGLEGRTVTADTNGDGIASAGEPSAVTAGDGAFMIEGLLSEPVDLLITPTLGWVSNHTSRGALSVDLTSGDSPNLEFAQATVFETFVSVASRGFEFLRASLHPTSGFPRNEATASELASGTFSSQTFVPAQLGHVLGSMAGAHAFTKVFPEFTSSSTTGLFDDAALITQLDKTFPSLQTLLTQHAFPTATGKLLYQVHNSADGMAPRGTPFEQTVSLLDNTQLIVGLQEITNYLHLNSSSGPNAAEFLRLRDVGLNLIAEFDLGAHYDAVDDLQRIRIGGMEDPLLGSTFDRITSETRQAAVAMRAYDEISDLRFENAISLALRESIALPGGPKHLPFEGGALEIWMTTPHASGELNTAYGLETLIPLGNAWSETLDTLPDLPAIGAMPIATKQAADGFRNLVIAPNEKVRPVDNEEENQNLLIGPAAGIMAGTLAAPVGASQNSAQQFALQNLASTVAAYREDDEYDDDFGLSNCLDVDTGFCDDVQDVRGTNEIGMMTEGLLNQLLGGSFYTDLLAQTASWANALNEYYDLLNVPVISAVEAEIGGTTNSQRGNASGGLTRRVTAVAETVTQTLDVPEAGNYGIRVPYSHFDSAQADAIAILVDDVEQAGKISLVDTGSWNVITHSDIISVGSLDAGSIDVIARLDAIGAQPVELDRFELVTIPVTIQQQPVVNVFASPANVTEGDAGTTFTVSRSGPTTADLTVELSRGGTATDGTDYTTIPSTVTILAGSQSADISLIALVDGFEELETIELQVTDSADYLAGPALAAIATIAGEVNQTPSFTASDPPAVLEDAGIQTVPGFATFDPGDPSEATQAVMAYTVSNITNPVLFAVEPAIDTAGNLTYTPADDAFGSSEFTVVVQDNGGTLGGGADTSAAQVLTITVNGVNDAPSFTASNPPPISPGSGAQGVAVASDFDPGPDNESSQNVMAYTVSNITNPAFFAVPPAIDTTGILTYTPAANAAGTSEFTVVVQDDGGTENGGVDTSAPQTISVAVINSAPTFTASDPAAVLEDSGAQSVGFATFDPGHPGESSQMALAYTVSNITNAALFAVEPAIDTAGNLTYTPADNAFGTSEFTVVVQDDGGTVGGGVDTSAEQVFTISVTGVNDAPNYTGSDSAAVLEDSGAETVNGFASFDPGNSLESAQNLIAYTVTNVQNATLFSVQPSIDNSGTLTFTPAANAFGTSEFTVIVQDDGGTANGGVDTSAEQVLTITINGINDPPTFTATDPPAVAPDSGAQTVDFFASFDPGNANETAQSVVAYTISGVTNAALFSTPPAIDTSGNLTYTPAAGATGTSGFTVTVKDDGGTSRGGVDTSDAQTFTITVSGTANARPTFTASDPPAVAQDSGAQTVTGFATFDPGAPSEAGQMVLAYTVSAISNAALFSAAPSIDSSGNLTYTPADGAIGTSDFTVTVRDDGGTAGGGNDTSAPQTFTITVTEDPVGAGVLDVTGSGTPNPFQDGIIIVRFMLGQPDDNLDDPPLIPDDATRTTGAELRAFLEAAGDALDANGDGTVNPFQDGILIVRFLLGQPDANLEDPALIPAGSTRTTGAEISAYLETLLPVASGGEFVPQASAGGEGEQVNSADVNGDGLVTMRDALNVVNEISRIESTDDALLSRLDTNQDGKVSASDALHVINRLADDVVRLRNPMADADDASTAVVDQLLRDEALVAGLF